MPLTLLLLLLLFCVSPRGAVIPTEAEEPAVLPAAEKSLDRDPRCHPEEAESHAKRATPDEGPMQLAGRALLLMDVLTPKDRFCRL
jgi:hypothetical protein